jgi:hypothetical protein
VRDVMPVEEALKSIIARSLLQRNPQTESPFFFSSRCFYVRIIIRG